MKKRLVVIILVFLGIAYIFQTGAARNSIVQPLQSSNVTINIRRDTSSGLPFGSVHSMGISQIVWGNATPGTLLMISLKRAGSIISTRNAKADQDGIYSVSSDRFIEDGDTVLLSDGTTEKTIQVPDLTYSVNTVTRIITGKAPANITSTTPGAPHSLQISIGGTTHQITTTVIGDYVANFTDRAFIAGLLGTIHYTTPEGANIYKPIFAVEPFARGKLGDGWADVIIGQPDFSQITYNEVVGNKLFNPGGVYVDRSSQPNRVYVNDSSNSRILGLSHLGVCFAGTNAGQNCTSGSNCPGSTCQIQPERPADIVLGQPSFNSSACNGDSGEQIYPDVSMASAETLCGAREEQISITEGGSQVTMMTDSQGNLYVPDYFNNRVLRYDSPFTTDNVADHVWGQDDFFGTTANRGAGNSLQTDSRSLFLASVPGTGPNVAGVAIDAAGNLWVADNMNNRVLRFPFNSALGAPDKMADLVLGQPDFSSRTTGIGLNQMDKPTSVRVDDKGVVFVTDSHNNRALAFDPPLSNGMFASHQIGIGLLEPTGLEIDPMGGLWLNDSGNARFLYFVDGMLLKTMQSEGRTWGGLGIDRDGSILTVNYDSQQGLHYSAPDYALDALFLRAESDGSFNHTSSRSAYGGLGLEVATGQLIYGSGSRMLFWNNPWSLTNYQEADGVVGEPDFNTQHRWGPWFQRMRADKQGRLWVINGSPGSAVVVYGYQLPLHTSATPVFTLTSPLPLQGGGVFTWSGDLLQGGIDVQPDCDCLWLSDSGNNRVFRIRDVSSSPKVDIILGQSNINGTHCNQGRDSDDGYVSPQYPTQDSLCHPGALSFDNQGNLFIADNNLEVAGNQRLLEFNASAFPLAPAQAVFGIPATHVLGRNGDFTASSCPMSWQDPMCGPWEPIFDSRGRMVIGFNSYWGSRFPLIYQDPLTNPFPVAAVGDFHSMPFSARFDQFDNLYILDGNRSRILIYHQQDVPTYAVTGVARTIGGIPLVGVYVRALGYAASAITDSSGRYTLTGLVAGTYTIEPSLLNYTFSPISRTFELPGGSEGLDFIGSSTTNYVYLPFVTKTTSLLKLAFDSNREGNFEIFTMNANGSEQTRLTNNIADDERPSWSPDGKHIAFRSHRDGNWEIYTMNADGSSQIRLTYNSAEDGWPSWSPDGNHIAFPSDRDGNWEIYVMNADSSGQVRLTNNATWDTHPVWSPDGKRIAFASYRDGNFKIMAMNADGSGEVGLTNNIAADQAPAWSPDGTHIAFFSNRDGNDEIYVMNADGSGQRRLTDVAGSDIDPAWSPSGENIAFMSNRNGNWEIYVMNSDGTNQTRLTNNAAEDGGPDWAIQK